MVESNILRTVGCLSARVGACAVFVGVSGWECCSWEMCAAERCMQLRDVCSWEMYASERCVQLRDVCSWEMYASERCVQLRDVCSWETCAAERCMHLRDVCNWEMCAAERRVQLRDVCSWETCAAESDGCSYEWYCIVREETRNAVVVVYWKGTSIVPDCLFLCVWISSWPEDYASVRVPCGVVELEGRPTSRLSAITFGWGSASDHSPPRQGRASLSLGQATDSRVIVVQKRVKSRTTEGRTARSLLLGLVFRQWPVSAARTVKAEAVEGCVSLSIYRFTS